MRYVVEMIVERTFRETRRKGISKKVQHFSGLEHSWPSLSDFGFRTGDIFDLRALALEVSLQSQACSH
jgi:hypothetical protein